MISSEAKRSLRDWLYSPQPIERLALLRIGVPLAVLGFMSSRVIYADYWLGDAGFAMPDLGADWRQPLYVAPLPATYAWLMAAALMASGFAVLIGWCTRLAAALFAATLAYVGLADRLSSFTVTKLSPILALTICFSAAGARYGIDAWLAHRRDPQAPIVTHVVGGPVRFIQILLPTFYFSSGICKIKGDWLNRYDVLWTQLHDSYQTPISLWFANHVPASGWALMQTTTLIFEAGAPLWFGIPKTRPYALVYGLTMHLMIGTMFGPVKWFAVLMFGLLLVAFCPESLLKRGFAKVFS